ncbi:MAG: hypothetical protein LBR28_00730 [Bacteroidales bacterium]|jgi:hypothetical protein|nr:hypothetical protein [Bacteroidales bacterium]
MVFAVETWIEDFETKVYAGVRLEDGKLIGQIKSPMGILQFEAERV